MQKKKKGRGIWTQRKTHTTAHIHSQCHMNIRTDIGMMHLYAKECQRLAADDQKSGEKQNRFSFIDFRKNQSCYLLDLELLVSRTIR